MSLCGPSCAFSRPIADASGSFEVTGRDDAPQQWGVGTWTGGTGSLNVYTCVPSQESDLLDALTLDLELVLFEIDDQPVDLEVGTSDTVNVLWGTVWDIEGITDWTTDESFVNFEDGSSSFSELDKEGRLVGTIEITQTDPPGPPLTIDVDLRW